MKDKLSKLKPSEEMRNYYNEAPEHNSEMNARGFRNFIIVVFAIALCIVMYSLIYQCIQSWKT
jgi:cell division septal protein FtsQ